MSSLRSSLSTMRGASTLSRSAMCRSTVSRAAGRSLRTYATEQASSSKQGSSYARKLLAPAAVGFTAGLVYVLAQQTVQNESSLKCDGAPVIDLVDTIGRPWAPANALEQDDPRNPMRIRMAVWVKNLQDHIVNTLEAIENASDPLPTETSPTLTGAPKFIRDAWIRPEGGEGSSCVLAGGRVFEKAGVNVSIIHGNLPPAAQKQMRADHATLPVLDHSVPFFAAGLSIVIHPRNPHVPTVHLNYRYLEVENPENKDEPIAWWFGGGSDLTPSYIVEDDIKHFHTTLREACDKHHPAYWPKFKAWCDKYFYIPHRAESRGVGGLFFDDISSASPIHADKKPSQQEIFDFVKDISGAFLPAYIPIVWKNKDRGYTEEERRWQLLRRGRYVEFNLVYDRGTKFGLMTPGARIESILMSLPEIARWEYMSDMGAEGTKEGDLMDVLRKPREWTGADWAAA